ncbi:unnamed protein product [Periconia digitata]|uniref:FAD-binding PCMH-type domain-containing protein n=1 Tax=Periconia digitata TaxID=1303443 RepID=A0A9W4U3V6_9PLEO|nr:unnamed protein product [Periconia digitata]
MFSSYLLPLGILLLSVLSLGHSIDTAAAVDFSLSRRASNIRQELGPKLSKDAVIIDAESGDMAAATKRWQVFASPSFSAVVEVATENDIVETIAYANAHSIPFLAVNAGHGEIKSLANMKDGIQITIRALNKITINEDNTATVQGGATNLEITQELWAAKKQTVSGTCECVGFLGPMLGGGHGWIQGLHGLAADQIIKARVILANGTIVSASTTENPDLFWALRGAGHNFGIVSEVTNKIYDVPDSDEWYFEKYTYTGASVDQLFDQLEKIKRDTPPELQFYSVFLNIPAIDSTQALVFMAMLYNGPASAADKWMAPFRTFNPIDIEKGSTTYPELSALTGNGINDDICQHEPINRIRYPLYLDGMKKGVPKQVYNLYNATTAQYPALNRSLMLFEGLSTQAVRSVQLDTTAVALRKFHTLASPVVTYAPDAALDQVAQDFGRELRNILHRAEGTPEMYAYVNYAVGEEDIESIYGYRGWRVAKLKTLKKHLDPENRFRFYAPIVSS